jgi:hypothetical protein
VLDRLLVHLEDRQRLAIVDPGRKRVLVEEQAELGLALPELDLRLLLAGDVEHEAVPILRRTLLVEDDHRLVVDPDSAAVLRDQPVLRGELAPALSGVGPPGAHPVVVVRVKAALPAALLPPFGRLVSDQAGNLGADIEAGQ